MTAEGLSLSTIQRVEGYEGADGLIGLSTDGGVRRGLGLFEVQPGGTRLVQPGPQTLAPPGA